MAAELSKTQFALARDGLPRRRGRLNSLVVVEGMKYPLGRRDGHSRETAMGSFSREAFRSPPSMLQPHGQWQALWRMSIRDR